MKDRRDIGEEFPMSAELIEAQTRQIETKTRRTLAFGLAMVALIALAAVAIYSGVTGSLAPLISVWSALAFPLGAIFAHYFGKTRQDDKGDDPGSTRTP